MYRGKKILGLIPARGGSKGLPRKNIKLLLGKPLIAWTIEQALASKYLDRVIVSTDDKEIAEISKKYGAEVPFMRPKELARDDSTTSDVILHVLNWFESTGEKYDYLALLEPTSPLREKNDIDNGIMKLIENENKANSLVSVGEIALEHPFISKKINDKGCVKPFYKVKYSCVKRRQDLSKAYFPYGVLYLSKVSDIKEYKTFYQKKTMPMFIKRWQNYEIDDIWDFVCIEAILKRVIKREIK